MDTALLILGVLTIAVGFAQLLFGGVPGGGRSPGIAFGNPSAGGVPDTHGMRRKRIAQRLWAEHGIAVGWERPTGDVPLRQAA